MEREGIGEQRSAGLGWAELGLRGQASFVEMGERSLLDADMFGWAEEVESGIRPASRRL